MRTLSLLVISLIVATAAGAYSSRVIRQTQPAICRIDSLRLAITLEQINNVLDPAFTDPEHLARVDSMGLTGVLPGNATIVSDSAQCSAARTGYLMARQPTDSAMRASIATLVPSVILVRLSPNRYLINGGQPHPRMRNHVLLTDSSFVAIPFLFY